MRRHDPRLIPAVAIGVVLAACGSSQPSSASAATLLAHAKATLDAAPSAHFTLTSSGPTGNGTALLGGSGHMQRPSSFSGRLNVAVNGFTVTVDAVSVNGAFYVRDPLTGSFDRTDPSAYGFSDPSGLMNPHTGLSTLLTQCHDPKSVADDRLNGVLLHEVSCSIPGKAVGSLLPDAAPDQAVAATIGVAADSSQLRRVVLRGPFNTTSSSTYTMVLDSYGENVTITPPATGS